MSGTSGVAGGGSLGKPLRLACHLASVDSGWYSKSCKVDLREKLKRETKDKRQVRARRVWAVFFTANKKGEEEIYPHETESYEGAKHTRAPPPSLASAPK